MRYSHLGIANAGGTPLNVTLRPVAAPDLAARFIANPLQPLIGDA